MSLPLTEVAVKLALGDHDEKLRGFASITLGDELAIHDLKIIEGAKGLFIAMPSRKLCDRCHDCGAKNHLRARFCNECGTRLADHRASLDVDGRAKLHAAIAHPIRLGCRGRIQEGVLAAYHAERAAHVRASRIRVDAPHEPREPYSSH